MNKLNIIFLKLFYSKKTKYLLDELSDSNSESFENYKLTIKNKQKILQETTEETIKKINYKISSSVQDGKLFLLYCYEFNYNFKKLNRKQKKFIKEFFKKKDYIFFWLPFKYIFVSWNKF